MDLCRTPLQLRYVALLILCASTVSFALETCSDLTGEAAASNLELGCDCRDDDADGWTTCAGDCDDADALINPGRPEVCDGHDSNCDGCTPAFDVDVDGDGVAACAGDCNDADPARFPGNMEGPAGSLSCMDFIDNDCNNLLDKMDPACQVPACEKMIAPGQPHMFTLLNKTDNSPIKTACDWCHYDQTGQVDERWQCKRCHTEGDTTSPLNGSLKARYPLAPPYGFSTAEPLNFLLPANPADAEESCGSTASQPGSKQESQTSTCAENCGPVTDSHQFDMDGDGYLTCGSRPDCDDFNARIHPDAVEICMDSLDNNCDGQIDGVESRNCICTDTDADGWTTCAGDCDDYNASIYPGANELCDDFIDNNCDGLTDLADLPVCLADCPDQDLDGYRDMACGGTDCNDENETINPGMPEICDGLDSNCDGCRPDDDVDLDGDGVANCAGDCDDEDNEVHPGSIEGPLGTPSCADLIDNNCDEHIDLLDAGCAVPTCETRTEPKNGPHMFSLLDPTDDSIIKDACTWCHFDDTGLFDERRECQRCHADPGDFSDPYNGLLKVKYPKRPPYGFGTARNVKMHTSKVVGTTYGRWQMNCITCHNPHLQEQDARFGTTHGKYIRQYVCYNNLETNQAVEALVRFTGETEFADGPPYRENLCDMCHTRTNHHQSYGIAPEGQSHNDAKNCRTCHSHAAGISDRIWGLP